MGVSAKAAFPCPTSQCQQASSKTNRGKDASGAAVRHRLPLGIRAKKKCKGKQKDLKASVEEILVKSVWQISPHHKHKLSLEKLEAFQQTLAKRELEKPYSFLTIISEQEMLSWIQKGIGQDKGVNSPRRRRLNNNKHLCLKAELQSMRQKLII